MTIIQLLRILWGRRYFIILSGIACCIAATLVAAWMPSYYQSAARVEMKMFMPSTAGGGAIDPKYAAAYVATQAELIGDYGVTGRAVEASGLLSSPQLIAQYQASPARQTTDFRRWVADQLSSSTSVALVPDSNILEIRYVAGTAEAAAGFADLMRTAYIDESLATQRSRALQTAQWFDQQHEEISQRLAVAEKAKTDFEREHGVVMLPGEMTASEWRLRRTATNIPHTTVVLDAPPPSGSQARLAEVQQAIAAASETMGPNHPTLIALREQERVLAATAARERAAATSSAPKPASADESLRAQQNRVLAEGASADELRRLSANIALLRELYVNSAKRAADAEMQAESTDVALTPIGSASVPTERAFPNYPLVIGLSFGFGLAIGILTALFFELLAMKVRHVEDLQILGVEGLNILRPASSLKPEGLATPHPPTAGIAAAPGREPGLAATA